MNKFMFKLRLSLFAFVAAWKQADDACNAVYNSCETGKGWNHCDFADGFIDLYSPIHSHVYKGR